MSIIADYIEALSALSNPRFSEPELLPARLAAGCVRVLPIQGAGISLLDGLRVPLGASDATAQAAERLQTTVGEGPCLSVGSIDSPVTANARQLARRWPAFHDRLVNSTSIRSIASLPLAMGATLLGAIDFYWTTDYGVADLPLAQAQQLAGYIAASLLDAPVQENYAGVLEPIWLAARSVRQRMRVWQAVGLVSAVFEVSQDDGLALLRAVAFSLDSTLDDVSGDLLSGRLPIRSVAP